MDPRESKERTESVWASPPTPKSEESPKSPESGDRGATDQEGPTPPYGYGREFVRSIDPGTIGKLVEHEVAAMLEMAEDAAYWLRERALDAIKDAETKVNEVQRVITDLAQDLHDIVESVSSDGPGRATEEEAPFDAGPSDVVEIPPSDEVQQAPDQSS